MTNRRISAEVRALELLWTVVKQSGVWKFERGELGTNICSTDFYPKIILKPLQNVQGSISYQDTHLEVHMEIKSGTRKICILIDPLKECAVVDGLISIVLLGTSGWPRSHTPITMRYKATRAAQERNKERDQQAIAEFGLPLQTKEMRRFKRLLGPCPSQQEQQRLRDIFEYARELYVRFSFEMDDIQQHIEPLLAGMKPSDLDHFLQHPGHPSDLLFLPPSVNS